MTTYQTPLVIGIFQDEIQAKNAVDALKSADFRYDQVGVAMSSSMNATSNLQADLVNLGVPEEQAHYYDEEYKSGKIVVSIRPDGRDSEVQDILTRSGAYNYEQREPVITTSAPTSPESETADDNVQAQDTNSATPDTAQDEPADTTGEKTE
ncbi:hypothetical protein [Dictyobacter aurantiacus]|uniref:General stress protein 17M-like domain-containing protein n=1 Tax=Dictyobacter aurantiacus TaxID=1936993 RepID=A0A401ZEA8_9CHLR|nr:hypothetical protein [Dictyobacter aurantiacus]GCE05211.1 hypothetical protein KDAU_25400 [Dictyobacter aurantiacus]